MEPQEEETSSLLKGVNQSLIGSINQCYLLWTRGKPAPVSQYESPGFALEES